MNLLVYMHMAQLTADEVRHLSFLARLELTPEEEARYAGQLSNVVNYVEQLQAVPTDHVNQLQGVSGVTNRMAKDEVRQESDLCSVERDALLKGTPKSEAGFIMGRAVMNGEGGGA